MNMKSRRIGNSPNKQNQMSKKHKQRGVTILQVLIGTVIAAIASIVAINAANGSRAEAQMNQGVEFAAADVSSAMTSYFFSNGRRYFNATLTTGAANATTDNGATMLVKRFNLRNDMPWGGDTWSIQAVPANAAAAQTVSIDFACSNIGPAGTVQVQRCTQLRESIAAAGADLIGTNCTLQPTATAPTAVRCVYGRPN